MKLRAKQIPYSSVVGGGLTLMALDGHTAFQVMFCGTNKGISKEQDAAMSSRIVELINQHGLEVPDHQ